MTVHAPIAEQTQPRARGQVRIATKLGPRGTVLDDLYQEGAARAVFPRSATGLTAVLLNTSGGVTGGDRFDYGARAGAGTHLTLTTQACERAYRAQPHETGQIQTTLRVAEGATLWWLPQETLLFDGCNLARHLVCDVAQDARALIVEPICFGRLAMGETRVSGTMRERIEINRRGAPLVRDAWLLTGDISAQLDAAAAGGGARAMVSLTFIAPEAEGHLAPLRALIGPKGGASLLAPDVLVLRALATSGYTLRKQLLPILDYLTGSALPLCWRL